VTSLVADLIDREPDSWLTTLTEQYKISAVRDGDLVSLKYNQIESPMHEPIVQECRGMVVDTARRQVLAWPYNKFWNHGEELADPIDWSTARVQEKLDGSLMILFHDSSNWRVASSGHPTAGGSFGDDARTFRDAFWSTFADLGLDLSGAARGLTYMFEMCDAPNRVVVKHDCPRIVLHGMRLLDSGREATRSDLVACAGRIGCELVREFPISSVAECLAAADALDPIQQEGYVVVDGNFNRIKIKSPRYVTLHHLKGEATPRRAIELWQTGEHVELLAHFPEFRPTIEPVHDKLDDLARRAFDEHEEAMCRSVDRKTYASMATRYPFSAVMFRMLTDGNASVDSAKAIMRKMSLAALERMVGL
jgi:hypothetical protein